MVDAFALEVLRAFDGGNVRGVARRFGVSLRVVYCSLLEARVERDRLLTLQAGCDIGVEQSELLALLLRLLPVDCPRQAGASRTAGQTLPATARAQCRDAVPARGRVRSSPPGPLL